MARSPGRQATRNERQPLPFWVGLVSGFFLGILVSSVLIYRDYNLERQRAAEATRPAPAMTAPAPSTPSLPSRLLDPIVTPLAPRAEPAPPPVTPAPSVTAVPPPAPAPAASSGGRSLVAGSMKSRAEAEQRKAELALIGLSSQVVETIVNGERRFRVTVGPFRSEAELGQTRAQLEANGIKPFVSGN